jgi:agmatinase
METYSPYQDKDLQEIKVCDTGDLEIPFGNSAEAVRLVETAATGIIKDGKIPFMLGGEHLLTLGAVKAAAEKYKDLYVLHFDAHLDLRDEILGETLSHGTVMRRTWEFLGDGKIFQFCIRSGTKEEFEWGGKHVITHRYNLDGIEDAIKKLKGKPVYFSFDLDALDPGIMSGTGTPEAGGVSFTEMLKAVISLSSLNIIGLDLMELAPSLDPSGASTVLAGKMLREILLSVYR